MAKEEKKKTKRPTALKRDIRNDKHRLINKSFKSNARTMVRNFEEALQTQDKERQHEALKQIYSVADKGVKRGIYKPNKAARIKARAHQKIFAQAS
jgi:small subunit ribosomal protein S20